MVRIAILQEHEMVIDVIKRPGMVQTALDVF
jgi:hypothetical protein